MAVPKIYLSNGFTGDEPQAFTTHLSPFFTLSHDVRIPTSLTTISGSQHVATTTTFMTSTITNVVATKTASSSSPSSSAQYGSKEEGPNLFFLFLLPLAIVFLIAGGLGIRSIHRERKKEQRDTQALIELQTRYPYNARPAPAQRAQRRLEDRQRSWLGGLTPWNQIYGGRNSGLERFAGSQSNQGPARPAASRSNHTLPPQYEAFAPVGGRGGYVGTGPSTPLPAYPQHVVRSDSYGPDIIGGRNMPQRKFFGGS